MPADRLLATLLRSLQTSTIHQDTPQLLSTASHLLSNLINPLNITLLTAQILAAPAIWDRPDGLRTCLRVLGVFHSASASISNVERREASELPAQTSNSADKEAWVRAVIKGADERSPRWRHLLVIGGILLGSESQASHGLSRSLRSLLESALVKAVNLALAEVQGNLDLRGSCLALVLNHTFELLSDGERSGINYDLLLPVLIGSALFSQEGFQSGYFLGTLDADVVQVAESKFNWPLKSSTFYQVEAMSTRPLMIAMGPLSRLIAHSAEYCMDSSLFHTLVDDLYGFARTLTVQWRQNKLSEIDVSEESSYLQQESLEKTLPVLWQVLKASMFTVIVVLRAVIGRILSEMKLANDNSAPILATRVLHTLRNLYFISSRLGSGAFSQYKFVSLAAVDILIKYPEQAKAFIVEIKPSTVGSIPEHPLERCLDLFFLNTAEHFTLALSPHMNENLLMTAAGPYLVAGGNNSMLEIFEAAHSVMLAVLAAPQSILLTGKHLPTYVDALFKVFPTNLSPRQFRFAFKTLLQITTPPSSVSITHPLLPSIILQLLYDRALNAPITPLDVPNPVPPTDTISQDVLSEQAVLILTLLDSLQYLTVEELEEWLPLAAHLINLTTDKSTAQICRERFWMAMSSGEMDVSKAGFCVAWWSTRGGREMVLNGRSSISTNEQVSEVSSMRAGCR